MLLSTDAHEQDPGVQTDNTVVEYEFRPEIMRYGGEPLIERACDMFSWSSLEAWDFCIRNSKLGSGNRLLRALLTMLWFSLHLVNSVDELKALWTLAPGSAANPDYQKIENAIYKGLGHQVGDEHWPLMIKDSRRRIWKNAGASYRASVNELDEATRLAIHRSHIHMLANRLGLANATEENFKSILEMYLSRWGCALDECCGHGKSMRTEHLHDKMWQEYLGSIRTAAYRWVPPRVKG